MQENRFDYIMKKNFQNASNYENFLSTHHFSNMYLEENT
jgi:hypothetical protein